MTKIVMQQGGERRGWVRIAVVVAFFLLAAALLANLIADRARVAGELGWSYAFVLVWRDMQQWLTRIDYMVVLGVVLTAGTITIIWRMSQSRTSHFDIADAFAGENDRTSMAKLAVWIGVMVTSWVMVAKTAAGTLTDTMFSAYLFALVLGKVGTEAVGVLRQAQVARTAEATNGTTPPDPPSPPSPTVTTTTTVAAPDPPAPPSRTTTKTARQRGGRK